MTSTNTQTKPALQFSAKEQKSQYTKADKIAMWYFGAIIFYLICQVARILF